MTVRDNDIELYSGGFLDVMDPDPSVIKLEDVASGLSKTCRFTGQCREFYSVAEHAVLCADRVADLGYPVRLQLAALHHDDHEAFICDIPRPIKPLVQGYAALASVVQRAILESLGLEDLPVDDPIVKDADNWALMQEAGELLPSRGKDWVSFGHTWDGGWRVDGMTPKQAYKVWLARHKTLCAQLANS